MSERNIFTRGLAPSYSSRGDEKIKSVLDSSSSPVSKEDAPSWKVTRDSQGNYYVNGTKAPWMLPPINPDAVPTVDPTSSSSGMDTISQMYTSPEREEELRKASVNKQRILALGDALRHIGNIYNTTRYAPAQIFNNPVNEERGRYLQEKAIRDANNYKYQTYQQAKAAQEAKIRQAERDYAFKVAKDQRDYGLAKAKADSQLKTDESRRNQIEAGIKKTNLEAEYIPKNFEEKKRMNDNTIRHQRVTEQQGAQRIAQGWARYNLAVSREEHRRKGNTYSGTDGKRDLFTAHDGSRYTFPKGVINGNNIEVIYQGLKDKKLITENLDNPTNAQKWDAIMAASSRSKEGLDAFISYAENLDYTYEGGRDLPYMRRIKDRLYDNKKAAPSSYPKKPASQPAKPATQKTVTKPSTPRATVSAGTKPSTGNTPKKKKGDFSGFSIYDN